MSRLVARAETWETVYTAFQNVNFAAFDYNTVKRSILDYIKLYFPETFNDFIESSELVAIIEVFAYIAELLAYRLDVNAHENFISTAQRKDSILRLAKLVSYSASRPLPARGLVKITSVSTTESIVDANGNDLANRTIRWNDLSNSNWKDQFSLVMNRVLDQDFGSVGPTDRFQLQDVLFETYSLNLTPLASGVFSYKATVNGTSIPMELVPVAYSPTLGVIERRPQTNTNFTLLYGQDGLGDASNTTGFFCFTKQGTLQRFRTSFDGITPNQTYDLNTDNVNDTDIWVNNVNPETGEILDTPSSLPYRRATVAGKSGEWVQVDLAHAQNVIFNTNPKRNKFEVETRANNRVRLIFGDGEFADVPSGSFDVWARTSLNEDVLVPQSSVSNASTNFTYVDPYGRTQTFTFTFSLVGSLQNASAAEDMEHVRLTAPAVYYSQDRMVNGEDYNVFPLQDPSILKLRAINRTFAGDSKYIKWHDASGTYENVKIFGDDGILYFEDRDTSVTTPVVDTSVLVSSYIEPLLSSTDLFMQLAAAGVTVQEFRRTFNPTELSSITAALLGTPPVSIHMYYNLVENAWYSVKATADITDPYPAGLGNIGYTEIASTSAFINTPLIKIEQISVSETKYTVTRTAKRLVFQSPTTKFWNANGAERIVNYDSLRANSDTINILQSNLNHNRDGVLGNSWVFNVLGQEIIEYGSEIGLPDENRLSVLPEDANQDGIPDNIDVTDYQSPEGTADIMMPKLTVTETGIVTLPIPYVVGRGDVQWVNLDGVSSTVVEVGDEGEISTTVNVTSMGTNNSILVTVRDYVYFTRESISNVFTPAPTTVASMTAYVADRLALTNLWKREEGRSDLHFAWFHNSPRYYLVDPSASNLIDSFVITKGYFTALKRWLEDPLAVEPDLPTPLDLRTSYGYLLDNKMISDTVVMHPGRFKILFGTRAEPPLQAVFKIVRSSDRTLTDNQIKTIVVSTVRNFFDVTKWEFGETFYFTELAAAIHAALPSEISTVVLVPIMRENHFGSLFQVIAREDEIFYPDVTVADIEIVASLNAITLNMSQENLILDCGPTTAPAPTTYELTADAVTVNEGGTVTVTLTTTNVPDGTPYGYNISGPGIQATDFASGSLVGTFLVTNNTASAVLQIAEDLTTEGSETVTVALNNEGAAVQFIIIDTSTDADGATYELSTPLPVVDGLPTVDEDVDFEITLTTTSLPALTAIGYSISGITSADLKNGHPNASEPGEYAGMTGSFLLGIDGTATLTFRARADVLTEGPETMVLTLNNGADSISIKILDTSNATPAPAPTVPTLTVSPLTITKSGTMGDDIFAGTITMSNTGTGTLTVTAIDVYSPTATYTRTGSYTPPIVLVAGGSASFDIYFKPTSAGQSTSNTITITSTAGTKVVNVSLSVTSGGPEIIEFYAVPTAVHQGSQVKIYYRVNGDTASTIFYETTPGFGYIPTSLGQTKVYTQYYPQTLGNLTLGLVSSDGTLTDTETISIDVYPPGTIIPGSYNEIITMNPSSFEVGTYATLTITGGVPNTAVTTLAMNGQPLVGTLDSSGNYTNNSIWVTNFDQPSAASVFYTFPVSFAGTGNNKSVSFTAFRYNEIVTSNPTTVAAGQANTISITGGRPYDTVNLSGDATINGILLDGNGNYSNTSVFVPAGTPARQWNYTLTFVGTGHVRPLSFNSTLPAAPPPPAPPPAPTPPPLMSFQGLTIGFNMFMTYYVPIPVITGISPTPGARTIAGVTLLSGGIPPVMSAQVINGTDIALHGATSGASNDQYYSATVRITDNYGDTYVVTCYPYLIAPASQEGGLGSGEGGPA